MCFGRLKLVHRGTLGDSKGVGGVKMKLRFVDSQATNSGHFKKFWVSLKSNIWTNIKACPCYITSYFYAPYGYVLLILKRTVKMFNERFIS